MANKILNIYLVANSSQPVEISTDSGGFDPQGDFNDVVRVDFFNLATGALICVFPCDGNSSVSVHEVFINFKLNFLSWLGRPSASSGFTTELEFVNQVLTFTGARMDGSLMVANSNDVKYLDAFLQLGVPTSNGLPLTKPQKADVAIFGDFWKGFAFGNLLYRIRGFPIGGQSVPVPVMTLERLIPANDDFGLRELPGPFSIPIALRTLGTHPEKIALRAVQRPDDNWLQNTPGAPTSWMIDIVDFQAGTITQFWKKGIVDRYIGSLHSVKAAEPVSLLPTLGIVNDADWRLRLIVHSSAGAASTSPLSLQLLGLIGTNLPAPSPVNFRCDGFLAHTGSALALQAVPANAALPSDHQPLDPWLRLSFSGVTFGGSDADRRIRIGSLDLALQPAGSDPWTLDIRFQRNVNTWVPRVQLQALKIPLSSVRPGGQDDPGDPQYARALAAVAASGQSTDAPGALFFRRENPLVIPIEPAEQDAEPLLLAVHENSVRGTNQQLTLTLSATSATSGTNDILVIDRNPFLVAVARLPDLASTASSETNEFAQWSNTFPAGPGWHISAGAGSFELIQPPQGVGEEMITGNQDENDGTRLADFRFSPSATATLKTSSQIQRYAEPGWNLRRVLGYPGQRAPGAGVDSMQFEMLYGLTCNVTAPGLHISEMFSRLGGFTGPLTDATTGSIELLLNKDSQYTADQRDQFDKLNKQWATLYRQLLSRLGVLELWDQERSFDLLLTDGVSYDLRPGANLEPRLKGGTHYALQLDELLTAVEKNPHSSSAVLTNPRFSAFGGYGRQRAGFNNDIIFVESAVTMGMLETLTITVIGRVANLWHHAKHVTVYERSVRPSRQFYLEQPLAEGRPLLRKTSEYIEVLQQVRDYPEKGPALGCGFVQGAEFKSIRINVDSRWRSNIGTGWIIPLWKPDAIPVDVYPKPHITVRVAGDAARGAESQQTDLLNPENVYFYTDPEQTTPVTDNWPPVESIDYSMCGPTRSTVDNSIPDSEIEPGFGRFTYYVGSDAAQINITSQRSANSMASALRTVTFMRAQGGKANPARVGAQQLHDYSARIVSALRAAAAGATKPAHVTDWLAKGEVKNLISRYQNAVGQLSGVNEGQLCASLSDVASKAFDTAAKPVVRIWTNLSDTVHNGFDHVISNVKAHKDSLQQALLSEVDLAFIEVQNAAGPVLADLSLAGALATQIQTLSAAIQNDLNELNNRVQAAATDDDWDNCRILALRCRDDVNATLGDARGGGDIQSILNAVSWLFGNRATPDAVRKLSNDFAGFSADLSAAFNAAIGGVTAKVAADAKTSIAKLVVVFGPAMQKLQDGLTALQTVLAQAAGLANPITAAIRKLRDDVRTAIKSVTTGAPDDFRTAIGNALNAWPDIGALLSAARAQITGQVSKTCTSLLGNLATIVDDIGKFFDLNAITGALGADAAKFIENIDRMEKDYVAKLDGAVGRILNATGITTNPASGTVLGTALTLVRAFGDPPKVPGLSFDMPSVELPFQPSTAVAYFYTNLRKAGDDLIHDVVHEIPVSAGLESAVRQVSSVATDAQHQLQQLGIDGLPTRAMLDRVLPNAEKLVLKNLSSLLPKVAGLDLTSMFSGIRVPDLASNNIHISHRIDPQTLQAALDVVLDFPIENYKEVTLFSLGPATVTVENCVFHAEVHVTGGVGQSGSQVSSGIISADWHVYIAGTEVLTFEKTALTFDAGGHLHFDIQPARVRLAAVLQFLTDLMKDIGLGGGFTLNLLPNGIQCVLSLPLPDISGGAFGITNLSLGCLFELTILPEFAVTVGANLSRRKAPFTLTIFILGGAGWFDVRVKYTPSSGKFEAAASIGIMASAGISISLGPISGGVFIYFGITAEYQSSGGLSLGILIIISGHVSLLGIIDVDITLLLEAEYSSGGGLIGRGEVDISIKICWCFTLDVHQGVEFSFGSAPPAHAAVAAAPVTDYATSVKNRINYLS